MIIDEKSSRAMNLPPPPAYIRSDSNDTNTLLPPFPSHRRRGPATFSTLPAHILLIIVYCTFPQTPGIDEGTVERQRKTLYWLENGLRLVDRAMYIASMHVLRSAYLPAYDSFIRPPYTSDPFPLSGAPLPLNDPTPTSLNLPVVSTIQRETATLDLFIALKVREDVWADDTDLHLESEERFKDLFDFTQPKSRLEDLVRIKGVEKGCINVEGSPGSKKAAISFDRLTVSFSTRKAGLILQGPRTKRTIVEVQRESRMEKLEVAARRLVRELQSWIAANGVQ